MKLAIWTILSIMIFFDAHRALGYCHHDDLIKKGAQDVGALIEQCKDTGFVSSSSFLAREQGEVERGSPLFVAHADSWVGQTYKISASLPVFESMGQADRLVADATGKTDDLWNAQLAPRVFADVEVHAKTQVFSEHSSSVESAQDHITVKTSSGASEILAPASDSLETLNQHPIAMAEEKTLSITIDGGVMIANPAQVDFAQVGDYVKVISPQRTLDEAPQIFVRDHDMIEWNPKSQKLVAKTVGRTEIFISIKGQLLIVPTVVGNESEISDHLAHLAAPRSLFSLDAGTRSFDGQTLASIREASDPAISLEDVALVDSEVVSEAPEDNTLLTLSEVKRSVQKSQDALDNMRDNIYRKVRSARQTTISLQFIDDRSDQEQTSIFPLPDLQVRVLGTEISATTDAAGLIPSFKVPLQSRLLVAIDDPLGRYRSSIAEIDTGIKVASENDPHVKRIGLVTKIMHQTLRSVLGFETGVDAGLGSLCFQMAAPETIELKGAKVSLDIADAQPVYFNQYGFVELQNPGLGPNKRACFFDLEPGPVAMTVAAVDQSWSYTVPGNVYESRHANLDVDLGRHVAFETSLVAHRSAEEHILDGSVVNIYRSIDWTELYSFSDGAVFLPHGDGRVIPANHSTSLVQGRQYYMVQAPEFEPTVYAVGRQKRDLLDHATALLPSGFIDRLATEIGDLSYDPSAGSILVDYGRMQGEPTGSGSTQVTLYDSVGRRVETGVALGNGGESAISKSIFLGLAPGVYCLVVTSGKGHWLASDTTIVYSETVSQLQLGSKLKVQVDPDRS